MNRLNKRRFSELSYSFSFLQNMIQNVPPGQKCCPILPSLFLEGRLGYDVKMRMPGAIFFFQFKVPKTFDRSSVYEKNKFGIGRDRFCGLDLPLLRMQITKHSISSQHDLLIRLQARKRNTSAKIFYATPLFIKPRKLGKKYRKSSVHYSSGFISPEEIGNLRLSDRHFVSYNTEKNHRMYGWVCADKATSMTRWPLNQSKLYFGCMKCVRIYRYAELNQIAENCQQVGKNLNELIEEVSENLVEVTTEIDDSTYISDSYEDYRKATSDPEYDNGSEAYKNACRYFNSDAHKNEVRLEKMKGHEGKLPPDWLSDIDSDLRESFESLYTLQHLARSYFGCETAIFQPE